MKRSMLIVVREMIAAIEGIDSAVAGIGLGEFSEDWLRRHAVQRGIEIVSEASRRIPPEILDSYPEIPWPKIKAIGNILRHEYHAIADEIVWNIVENSLPGLLAVLRKIAAETKE